MRSSSAHGCSFVQNPVLVPRLLIIQVDFTKISLSVVLLLIGQHSSFERRKEVIKVLCKALSLPALPYWWSGSIKGKSGYSPVRSYETCSVTNEAKNNLLPV